MRSEAPVDGGGGMLFGCLVYVLAPLLIIGVVIAAAGTWKRWNKD